jgi:hypothetical protein
LKNRRKRIGKCHPKLGKLAMIQARFPTHQTCCTGLGEGGRCPPPFSESAYFLILMKLQFFFSDFRIIRRKTAKFSLNSGISELFSKT